MHRIAKDDWPLYFDVLSQWIQADIRRWETDIEVFSPSFGDQIQGTALHLAGVTYDPRSNALEIASDQLGHMVLSPVEIWVDEPDLQDVQQLLVVREDGIRESVVLKRVR